jgi:hypothetical protein
MAMAAEEGDQEMTGKGINFINYITITTIGKWKRPKGRRER